MDKNKKPTIYGRLIAAIVSALIGAIIVPVLVLLFSGGLDFDAIGSLAIGGAVGFAIFGFAFPKPMGSVLFVLTLFQ